MLALLNALQHFERVGLVGHDVGAGVMQALARTAPERLLGLFFFDFVYPGIGARMATPDRLNEVWYQSFHQMAMAPALVGATRDSCRRYIGHFLRHWAHRQDAFDDVTGRTNGGRGGGAGLMSGRGGQAVQRGRVAP